MAELLHRTSDLLVRADATARQIFGVVVPYNQTADVSDGGPRYRERFAPGSLTRSIAERSHKIRLFAMHDVKRLPVGRAVDLIERDDGVHGVFAIPRTQAGDDALELVATGTVDSFSIGFTPIRDRREDDGTVVRVEAALREVSLVNEGAYAGALVAGVRSASSPRLSVELARRRLALIDPEYPWQ